MLSLKSLKTFVLIIVGVRSLSFGTGTTTITKRPKEMKIVVVVRAARNPVERKKHIDRPSNSLSSKTA